MSNFNELQASFQHKLRELQRGGGTTNQRFDIALGMCRETITEPKLFLSGMNFIRTQISARRHPSKAPRTYDRMGPPPKERVELSPEQMKRLRETFDIFVAKNPRLRIEDPEGRLKEITRFLRPKTRVRTKALLQARA